MGEAAGGTVRWGLRTGLDAWPDRSTPTSAVGELTFKSFNPPFPRVGGLVVRFLAGLGRLGPPERHLRGLAS